MKIAFRVAFVAGILLTSALHAQDAGIQDSTQRAPTTKLAAFKPRAGSVVTMGMTAIPDAPLLVSVEVRELKGSEGIPVRGVVISCASRVAFIDPEELPELLKGIDAVRNVTTNPTPLQDYQVTYTTKDNFAFIAYSGSKGIFSKEKKAKYAVRCSDYGTSTELSLNEATSLLKALQSAADLLGTLSR